MNFLFLPKNKFSVAHQQGSVLILVLFALILLSLLAFSAGYTVRQKLQVVSRLETRQKLRFSAEAAAMRAAALIQEQMGAASAEKADYQSLNQPWSQSESLWKEIEVGGANFSVIASGKQGDQDAIYGLVDEDRKVNLNTASSKTLEALFHVATGVDEEDARKIAAAIQDWMDEDEDLHDGGAESKDYLQLATPYRAQNAPFSALEQLRWVQGVDAEIFERVRPYLTLDAVRVNLNTASEKVLQAMGVNSEIAAKIIEFRAGKDGKVGTADDGVFPSLAEAPEILSEALYLSDADRQALQALFASGFSVSSEYFTAQIEARMNRSPQRIRAVAVLDREGGVKRWHEEFF